MLLLVEQVRRFQPKPAGIDILGVLQAWRYETDEEVEHKNAADAALRDKIYSDATSDYQTFLELKKKYEGT